MNNRKIRLGLVGGGSRSFIGIVHRIAAYMGEQYTLVGGVFDVDYEEGLAFANKLELDPARTYHDIAEMIEKEHALPQEERMEVISILTPNFLHFSMSKTLIEAGFHVICEKPMTVTAKEAVEIEELVERKNVVFCLTHTYTGYPMVRQMKEMIAAGVIGEVHKVDAQYYQGWINPFIHDKEKRAQVWRLDPAKSGQSCCMGDIGVHAFNMVEYTTGMQISKVLADLDTMYQDNPLDVDGTALVRFENGVKGVIRASQIATSEENNLTIAVYGRKGGLKWEQENPTYLTHLIENEPRRILKPGNSYNSEFSMESTKIAPGHPEGLFDAMGNIYSGTAKAILGQKVKEGAYPTVKDGVRGMKFIEAVLTSSKNDQVWVSID
ncbi:MAG: putative dehydrogenase [Cyclobacteriaceae bacterium]|jgi:predicted dehydrogenase